ncbi:unnamed protein product [Caenorhabditis brenneri]
MKINNFPIPDLPTSMLNNLLKKLGKIDLIHYSTTSEFCKDNVKSMLTEREVKLEISVEKSSVVLHHSFPETDERDCTIHINSTKDIQENFRFPGVRTTMNFNGKSVSGYVKNHTDLTVYWEKEIDGLIFMLDYLTELFPHMPICELRTGPIEDTGKVIEWINNRDKPEVERCSLCYSDTAEDVSKILDNVYITKVLEMFIKLPEDLMNDDLPAIRFCNIVLVSPNMDAIANGINYEKVPSQLKCYLKPTKYGRHSFNVFGVYDYERADGKVLSICSGFPDSITRNIMIFVRLKTEPLEF